MFIRICPLGAWSGGWLTVTTGRHSFTHLMLWPSSLSWGSCCSSAPGPHSSWSSYYPWSCLECAWVCCASWLPIWSTVQLPIIAEFLGDLAEDAIFTVRAIGKAIHLPPQYYRYPCHLHAWVNIFTVCIAISLWRGECSPLAQPTSYSILFSWQCRLTFYYLQLPVSLFSNISYR